MEKDLNSLLSLVLLKEGKRYVAYFPALDLCTSGNTAVEAKKRAVEAARIFFQEIEEKGTAKEILSELGWERKQKIWREPVIKHDSVRVAVA